MDEKDKRNKEITSMKKKSKTNLALDHGILYNQHFSEDDFGSEYEEECPVNYSLKYSETESCKLNKNEGSKEKYEEFTSSGYPEPDLYRPADFELKYSAEPSGKEGIKDSEFAYYENDKRNYKEYADYAETDLDQPTDFTLKYRESIDEEIKPQTFAHFENDKAKMSDCYGRRTEQEEVSGERVTGQYPCEDQTPLMFSRCSSLNSLSSFEHLTQSVADDGSSIVSEISHNTSGIVSPSELPDSPTQTAPSSPKRNKNVCPFASVDEGLREKKSVFEDDVATYKQEDTPIEFSRATSLSSLNMETSVKADVNLRTNSTASSVTGGDDAKNRDDVREPSRNRRSFFEEESLSGAKPGDEKKIEGGSAEEPDDVLVRGFNNMTIEKNSGRTIKSVSHQMPQIVQRGNGPVLTNHQFPVRPNMSSIFANARYVGSHVHSYPNARYETSDDDVITYHTEGTPANISHAGSHSDLSCISAASELAEEEEDEGEEEEEDSYCSKKHEVSSEPKERIEEGVVGNSVEMTIERRLVVNVKETPTKRNDETFRFEDESQLGYFKSGNSQSFNDEVSASTVNVSPCNYGGSENCAIIQSSRTSVYINRFDGCKGQVARQLAMPISQNASRFSSPSFGAESDGGKSSGDRGQGFVTKPCLKNRFCIKEETNSSKSLDGFYEPNLEMKSVKDLRDQLPCSRSATNGSFGIENWNTESCTPLEEDLVEQCIRLGMPRKNRSKKLEENTFKSLDGRSVENWHSKSCTPLEEALVEQCIRLGMPQKNKKLDRSHSLNINERKVLKEKEQQISSQKLVANQNKVLNSDIKATQLSSRNFSSGTPNSPIFTPSGVEISGRTQSPISLNSDNWFNESCTPLEEALVEECIRLGMPRKNNSKYSSAEKDDANKIVSSSQTSDRPKINPVLEKEKTPVKKVSENFVPARRLFSRRKKSKENCRKCKKCRDLNKLDRLKR